MIDGLHRHERPPAFIRLLWLAVTAAIAYLSLYPLGDWRLRQPSPFAFLLQGLPRYYTPSDLGSNVAAYVIFGLLFSLGWTVRRRPWVPPLLATVAGMTLSLSLEALQSYLPSRVPSMLDVSANSAGAAAGGILGALVAQYGTRRREVSSPLGRPWYEQAQGFGWALAVLWVVSQLPTQRLLFSTGNLQSWLPGSEGWLARWLPELLPRLDEWLPASLRSAHETATVAIMICVLGVLVMDLVRSAGWRMAWIAGLMTAGLALRVLSSPSFESSRRLLVLLTSGAQAGMLLGALALYLIGAFRRGTRLLVGVMLVLVGLLMVNLSPADPFFQTTQAAASGVLTPAMTPSLRSLISAIGALWPLLALSYFVLRLIATRRQRRLLGPSPQNPPEARQ